MYKFWWIFNHLWSNQLPNKYKSMHSQPRMFISNIPLICFLFSNAFRHRRINHKWIILPFFRSYASSNTSFIFFYIIFFTYEYVFCHYFLSLFKFRYFPNLAFFSFFWGRIRIKSKLKRSLCLTRLFVKITVFCFVLSVLKYSKNIMIMQNSIPVKLHFPMLLIGYPNICLQLNSLIWKIQT
jgi:hypothetical protein